MEKTLETQTVDHIEATPFAPHWPEGLKVGGSYRFSDDSDGPWLDVIIGPDGDVHLAMQNGERTPGGLPSPIPSVRCRAFVGGGHHRRVYQALLWLAQAIRLDSEEIRKA